MADSYTQKKISTLLADHATAVAQVSGAAQSLNASSRRAVQLWEMAAALMDDEDRVAAGAAFATDATAKFQESVGHIAVAIDAVALSTGLTREQILTALAEVPATNF